MIAVLRSDSSLFHGKASKLTVSAISYLCRVRWGNFSLRGNLGLFDFSLLKRS